MLSNKKIIVLAAVSGFATFAFAQQGPSYPRGNGGGYGGNGNDRGYRVDGIAYEGDGCPQGTASASLSRDQSRLTLEFDRMNVDTNRRESRRYCDITVPLQAPPGSTVRVSQVKYRGSLSLSSDAYATIDVEHFIDGSSRARTAKSVYGPTMNERFEILGDLSNRNSLVSRCGDRVELSTLINLSAEIDPRGHRPSGRQGPGRRGQQEFSSIALEDGHRDAVEFELVYEQCGGRPGHGGGGRPGNGGGNGGYPGYPGYPRDEDRAPMMPITGAWYSAEGSTRMFSVAQGSRGELLATYGTSGSPTPFVTLPDGTSTFRSGQYIFTTRPLLDGCMSLSWTYTPNGQITTDGDVVCHVGSGQPRLNQRSAVAWASSQGSTRGLTMTLDQEAQLQVTYGTSGTPSRIFWRDGVAKFTAGQYLFTMKMVDDDCANVSWRYNPNGQITTDGDQFCRLGSRASHRDYRLDGLYLSARGSTRKVDLNSSTGALYATYGDSATPTPTFLLDSGEMKFKSGQYIFTMKMIDHRCADLSWKYEPNGQITQNGDLICRSGF